MLRAGDCVWLAVLALLLMGVVMVRSAGLSVEGAGASLTAASVILSKPTLYAAMAMAALFAASRLPLERVIAGRGGSEAVGNGGTAWNAVPRGCVGGGRPLTPALSPKGRGRRETPDPGPLAQGESKEEDPSPGFAALSHPLPKGEGCSAQRFMPRWKEEAGNARGAARLRDEARVKALVILAVGTAGLLLLCLAVYAPGIGRQVNGAHRWIGARVGGWGVVGFQPSEVAKWGVVVLLAWWAGRMGAAGMRSFRLGLAPALLAAGVIAAAIAVEDLGTAALIALAACAALLAAGGRLWHFTALAPVGLAGFAAAVLAEPYRVRRLTAFLDPFADPQGAGYHMIQSMAAVSSGGVWGRGLGFGLHKFGYLPEDTTDFLFAIIAEELGFVGALVVVALYGAILWAGARIVRQERAPAMRVLAVGVLATLATQAAINIAAVTGLGPTKGIALPLLSAGGTGWILTAAALGVLVGMDRRAALAETRIAQSAHAGDGAGSPALT